MLSAFAKEVAKPVLVNLLTAVTIFVAALIFKGPILQLFGLAGSRGYPIACSGELYHPATAPDQVWLDFYFTNPTRDDFPDAQTLRDLLTEGAYDDALDYVPRVDLAHNAGWISFQHTEAMAAETERFNRGKGSITVNISDDGSMARLSLESIARYSTLKVTLAVPGLEAVAKLGDRRGTIGSLPIKNSDLILTRCYAIE